MRHASIEPGRMVASEYRLPLTRCLASADLTQEKPPTGGFFVLWVLGINPRGNRFWGILRRFSGISGECQKVGGFTIIASPIYSPDPNPIWHSMTAML